MIIWGGVRIDSCNNEIGQSITVTASNNMINNNDGDDYFIANGDLNGSTDGEVHVTITNDTITNNTSNGIFVKQFGGMSLVDTSEINVINTIFKNNGKGDGDPADLKFFEYIGNARIQGVTIEKSSLGNIEDGSNSYEIEFRGQGCDTALSTIVDTDSAMGTVTLSDVTISGTPNKVGLLIQCYADVSGLTLSGVDLSNVEAGLVAVAINHEDLDNDLDLGDTILPSLALWESSNGVNATNATFVNTTTNFEIEDVVYHILDTSISDNQVGLVTWVENNVYVTPISGSIQKAIDTVTANFTINVSTGTYDGALLMNSSYDNLTIQGSGAGNTIIQNINTVNENGITLINHSMDGFTIKDLTIQGFDSYGIKISDGGELTNLLLDGVELLDNGYGFYLDGTSITDAIFKEVTASNNTLMSNGRGLFFKNSNLQNIVIEDSTFENNSLAGIDFNILGDDGSIDGITIKNNVVKNNGDSGITILGATDAQISNNIVINNGRFGIELKSPSGDGTDGGEGSVVVKDNSISRTYVPINEDRDHAGIIVIERDRSVIPANFENTGGVVIKGNVVTGYTQTSDSDGFGIVIEGINNSVQNNIVSGNDVDH